MIREKTNEIHYRKKDREDLEKIVELSPIIAKSLFQDYIKKTNGEKEYLYEIIEDFLKEKHNKIKKLNNRLRKIENYGFYFGVSAAIGLGLIGYTYSAQLAKEYCNWATNNIPYYIFGLNWIIEGSIVSIPSIVSTFLGWNILKNTTSKIKEKMENKIEKEKISYYLLKDILKKD
ncbi:MAG: hypothetical protein QW103_02990 [Candidatus Pacearchaeota archaeon]